MKENNYIAYEEGNKKHLFTVKMILEDCLDDYAVNHEVGEHQKREVEKSLNDSGHENGCFVLAF